MQAQQRCVQKKPSSFAEKVKVGRQVASKYVAVEQNMYDSK